MKATVNRFLQHPLISGSTIIFFGSFLANVINFFFNQQMAVRLSLEEYGILASVIAFISLPSFAFGALGPIINSFAGKFFAEKEFGKVKSFLLYIYTFAFYVCVPVCILYIFFIHAIGDFFHIQSIPLLILALGLILISLVSIINQSFLQAKLSFGFLTITNIVSSSAKLLLAVILVYMGFGVSGVVWGIVIAYMISYILTYFPLRFVFSLPRQHISMHPKALISYSIHTGIALISLTLFISTDLILVKHFFSSEAAGLYAGLSLIGKVIFYFSAPIGTVMFPLIVHKKERNENYFNTFLLSLGVVLVPSVVITIIYFFAPTFIIELFLRRSEYLHVSNLVGFFALSMIVYSLLTVTVNFYLSIKKTFVWIPLLCGALLQGILIYTYHGSFFTIIMINLSIETLLFAILLGGYFLVKDYEKQ